MKKTSDLQLFLPLGAIIFINCNNTRWQHSAMANDTTISFNDRVTKTRQFVTDLTDPSAVFETPDFVTVYENPLAYKEDAIKYLAEQGHTEDEKCIAIYSMTKLELDDYIEFAEQCYTLFRKRQISEDLLASTIIYPFTNKQNFQTHRHNAGVKKLIDKIKKDETISYNFRRNLESF